MVGATQGVRAMNGWPQGAKIKFADLAGRGAEGIATAEDLVIREGIINGEAFETPDGHAFVPCYVPEGGHVIYVSVANILTGPER